MARIMNPNLPHVSIPNGPREQPNEQPEQRRPTAFGADMDTGRMTQYFSDGSQETHYNGTPAEELTPQQQMFNEVNGLIQKGNAARKQKRDMNQAMLATQLVTSRQNGGFMHPDTIRAFNAQTGMNAMGANYDSNGNYIIYGPDEIIDQRTGKRLSSGRIKPIAMISPEQQYQVLRNTGLGKSMLQDVYNRIAKQTGLTETQLEDRGIVNPEKMRDAADAQAARQLMKDRLDEQKYMENETRSILKDIDALQKDLDANIASMDEESIVRRKSVIANAYKMLESRYLPKANEPSGDPKPVTELPEGLAVGDEREVTTKDGKRVTVVLKQKGDGSYVWASK